MKKNSGNKILYALKLLTSFEEDMAEFYESMSAVCREFPEFWESASMLKSTRANLYTNLIQDYAANVQKYTLTREVNGLFISLTSRVKSQKERFGANSKIPRENDRFIQEVENATNQPHIMPLVEADTPAFNKINIILEKTQSRQNALIDAYLKSGKLCR